MGKNAFGLDVGYGINVSHTIWRIVVA